VFNVSIWGAWSLV